MLTKNLAPHLGLANGSRGVIIDFKKPPPRKKKKSNKSIDLSRFNDDDEDEDEEDEYEDEEDEEEEEENEEERKRKKAAREYDRRRMDPKTWEATSHISPDLLVELEPLNEDFGKSPGGVTSSRPRIKSLTDEMKLSDESKDTEFFPVVQFTNGVIRTIRRARWSTMCKRLKIEGIYETVPLKLAWTITIHKGQGMSLDKVETCIDENVFEYGQAYTAVSRACSLEGLLIPRFDPSAFAAHPKVKWFYENECMKPLPADVSRRLKEFAIKRSEELRAKRLARQARSYGGGVGLKRENNYAMNRFLTMKTTTAASPAQPGAATGRTNAITKRFLIRVNGQ
jgi:hypothetical protein